MIYFDNNSTTRVHDDVLATMLPYFTEHFGNYSSANHAFGWIAKSAVEQAREQVARLINCATKELIFTGGATESINAAINSVASVYGKKRKKILYISTEHKAVMDVLNSLEHVGFQMQAVDVDREGMIDIDYLNSILDESVLMICVMLANNETGVIHPLEVISKMAKDKGIIVFCDATQAVGKIPVDVDELNVDLMCFSGHKFHGPKGCGALYIRSRNPRMVFKSFILGGGQEGGKRSGTLNVPGIVGFGKASDLARLNLWENMAFYSQIRNHFEHQLLDYDISINGNTRNRLSNTSNIYFHKFKASTIISSLKNVAVSMGSACTSESIYPSHVLSAMNMSDDAVQSSIRFSFSIFNSIQEVDSVLNMLKPLLNNSKN